MWGYTIEIQYSKKKKIKYLKKIRYFKDFQ